MSHEKKERERHILDAVYGHEFRGKVVPDERPDFRMRHSHASQDFGVEVSEFYFSESDARFKLLPGYVDEILAGNPHRHRLDKLLYPLVDLTITGPDKPDQQVQGILREFPSISAYSDLLAEHLLQKDHKRREYQTDLSHVNLIVSDSSRRLGGFKADDLYATLLTDTLRKAINTIGFREVFVITQIEDQRWVYLPLTLVILLGELYLFNFALMTYHNMLCANVFEELSLFAKYLSVGSSHAVYTRIEDGKVEVVHRGYGVLVSENRDPTIRDYADHESRNGTVPISAPTEQTHELSELLRTVESVRETHRFSCSVVRDLMHKPP